MIHYHGTPISGNNVEIVRFLRGRHALVSFAAQQDIAAVAEYCSSFVLDNGAFTFWQKEQKAKEKAGANYVPNPPDWDEYVRWVEEWRTHPGFAWWLIPDVIDGDEDDNWRLMYHYGRMVPFGVPVYHLHESLEHLERMLKSYPRIALGSSGQWSTPGTKEWQGRMAEVMNVICDCQGRPRVKLHGLRMLNPRVFTKYPLESADSCNAGINCNAADRWDGAYKPPLSSQRAEVIAWRIEGHQSARAFHRKCIAGINDHVCEWGPGGTLKAARCIVTGGVK